MFLLPPSLPVWECGLKYKIPIVKREAEYVTPCVGVWIEIASPQLRMVDHGVTPCVGVWIEIT